MQADTVTVNLHYSQTQETFYRRQPFWSRYFFGAALSHYGPVCFL